MKLYLMRHGVAEHRTPSGRDGDRALTPEGRRGVLAVAKKLVDLGEAPREILTSPLVRAVQTAEIVAVAAPAETGGHVDVRRDLAPGGDVSALARQLAAAQHKRVLLVGHEPELSAALARLVRGFDRGLAKAMVVGVHLGLAPAPGRVRFVLEPSSLDLRERGPVDDKPRRPK